MFIQQNKRLPWVIAALSLMAISSIVALIYSAIVLGIGSWLGVVDDRAPGMLTVSIERIDDTYTIWTYTAVDLTPIRRLLVSNGVPKGEQVYIPEERAWSERWTSLHFMPTPLVDDLRRENGEGEEIGSIYE